jgi:carbonic anhydrase
MEKYYQRLLDGNKRWVAERLNEDPHFFDKLAEQHPPLLWIGCSDSRVPANQITNTQPGEVFVHRNIANMVVHTDINMLSVLDYAVQVLKVKHVLVVGHYGCGGIIAAMSNKQFGLIDNWLRNIKDVYRLHQEELEAIGNEEQRCRRLVELNVIEQVNNLCKTSSVQNAWEKGDPLHIHGWVYDIKNGLINDLDVTVRDNSDLQNIYKITGSKI